MRSAAAIFVVTIGAALAVTPQTIDANLPPYLPRRAAPPKHVEYVVRDGSIAIVGYNDMAGIFVGLNELFTRTHPGFKFKMELKGTATAAPALTFGVSAFAPMGAEFSAMELASYKSVVESDPEVFRIAHCSLDPRALSAPVGIFVNRTNPIQRLTTEQVAHIFTTGHPAGDITHWSQLGLTGEWVGRSIHPCGIAEEAAAGLAAFMLKRMGGRPFRSSYDAFAQSAAVVTRVAEDPEAIGFASANIHTSEAKMLEIAARDGARYVSVTPANIMSGDYPYDRYLFIYVRHTPGEPRDPFVTEYLRMALSKDGQTSIAAAPPGYLPLNAREVARELSKLQ